MTKENPSYTEQPDLVPEAFHRRLNKLIVEIDSCDSEELLFSHMAELAEIYHVCNSEKTKLYMRKSAIQTAEEFSDKVIETIQNEYLPSQFIEEGKIGIMIGVGPDLGDNPWEDMKKRAEKIIFSQAAMPAIDKIFTSNLGKIQTIKPLMEVEISNPKKSIKDELQRINNLIVGLESLIDQDAFKPAECLKSFSSLFNLVNLYINGAESSELDNYKGFMIAMANLAYNAMYRFGKAIEEESSDELIPVYAEIDYLESLLSGNHTVN